VVERGGLENFRQVSRRIINGSSTLEL